MSIQRQLFIDGGWRESGLIHEVRSPATGAIVAAAHRARPADLEAALGAAQRAFEITRRMPAWERHAILTRIAAALRERRDEMVRILADEAGKPIKAGRVEADRAIFTFEVAAEEARRLGGEVLPLDWAPWGADRLGIVRRFPLGPIAAIIPFNFPLNLAAHKIAPCIASGNTMVLKPASQTPSAALVLASIAHDAGLPAGALSVLPASSDDARLLVEDDRFRMLTFTGSSAVGWELKRRAGKKKVALELGGNAAVIVHSDADLDRAAERIAVGGFGYSGQSCISVQRVLVQRTVAPALTERLMERVRQLRSGDPMDEATDVGPLITEADARRAEAWVREAKAGGARLVAGGGRKGAWLEPTILADVAPDMKVSCEEIFAPVVALSEYDTFEAALAAANASRYGLQAGLFTRDAARIWQAFAALEVGGLMVDDVPSFRVDHMPYGGVKESGVGREGLRYAIEEMTEPRLLGWHVQAHP